MNITLPVGSTPLALFPHLCRLYSLLSPRSSLLCAAGRLQKYTAADVERADRELARLFVEMFDVIGDQVVSKTPTLRSVLS